MRLISSFNVKKYEDIRKDMFKTINNTNFLLGKSLKEKLISFLNCSNVMVIKAFDKFLKQSKLLSRQLLDFLPYHILQTIHIHFFSCSCIFVCMLLIMYFMSSM